MKKQMWSGSRVFAVIGFSVSFGMSSVSLAAGGNTQGKCPNLEKISERLAGVAGAMRQNLYDLELIGNYSDSEKARLLSEIAFGLGVERELNPYNFKVKLTQEGCRTITQELQGQVNVFDIKAFGSDFVEWEVPSNLSSPFRIRIKVVDDRSFLFSFAGSTMASRDGCPLTAREVRYNKTIYATYNLESPIQVSDHLALIWSTSGISGNAGLRQPDGSCAAVNSSSSKNFQFTPSKDGGGSSSEHEPKSPGAGQAL